MLTDAKLPAKLTLLFTDRAINCRHYSEKSGTEKPGELLRSRNQLIYSEIQRGQTKRQHYVLGFNVPIHPSRRPRLSALGAG